MVESLHLPRSNTIHGILLESLHRFVRYRSATIRTDVDGS